MKIDYHSFVVVLCLTFAVSSAMEIKQKSEGVNVGMTKLNPAYTNGQISFLEIKEGFQVENSLTSKELMNLEESLKEMFLAQINNRRKKRYTRGGKLCASVFVQDKVTYFDCTNNRSPDGKDKKQEWCYIDIYARDKKKWDYCKPIIDYDKVREKNQYELNVITVESRKVNAELVDYIKQAENAIRELRAVRDGHAELDKKILMINKATQATEYNLLNLNALNAKWVKLEQTAIAISSSIEKAEAEYQKKLKMAASGPKNYFPTDKVTIAKQEAIFNQYINAFVQKREKIDKTNCFGMEGYERDGIGKGLRGEYFDNEAWIGKGKNRIDSKIHFTWKGSSPILDVNAYNFSIKWTGFIKAPFTGNYKFIAETSDSVMVTFNNKIVIAHNMKTAVPESKTRNNVWMNHEIYMTQHPNVKRNRAKSNNIYLIGGNKYKIVISYYHSIHDLLNNEFDSGITFKWSSNQFAEEIIPEEYMFEENTLSPMKLSGFDSSFMTVSKLDNNSLAFKNSRAYFLTDIPLEYRGLVSIKMVSRYHNNSITFKINNPTYLYIAVLSHYPNPLPDFFEDTQQMMQVVKIKPNSRPVHGKLQGYASGVLRIYRKLYRPGRVHVRFRKTGANLRGIPMAIFFGPDNSGGSLLSCGGKEKLISKPGSKYFKKCKASSTYPRNKCEAGLQGKMVDSFEGMWYSKGEGVGAWLQVIFNGVFILTKFEVKPRKNPNEWNKVLELEFSDGSIEKFTLLKNDDLQTFKFHRKVQTSYVIIKIKEVYGTINNGGAFNFYGIECKNLNIHEKESKEANGLLKAAGVNPREIPALFNIETKEKFHIGCKDTLINSRKFRNIKMDEGNSIIVKCFSSCSMSPYVIYGNQKYTKDSAICKAAFHSKKISIEGGEVKLVFSAGLRQYDDATSNGIRSLPKTYSEVTMTFERIQKEDDIIVKEGSRIDVIGPNGNKYQKGVIKEIKENTSGKILTVQIENSAEKAFEIHYPDQKRILPCGNKIAGRGCNSSRKSLNKYKPVFIRFSSRLYKVPDAQLPDYGGIYGSTGRPFGWSKDIQNRSKYFPGTSKKFPLIETMIHFPPSDQSRYCRKDKKDTVCDKVDWSVKAGHGIFIVTLFFGDPKANSKIDLSLNGKSVFSGVVPKGHMKTIETKVEAKDEFIILSSECEKDCNYAMSKISGIKIFPFIDMPVPTKEEVLEEEKCGGSFEKGKCDLGKDILHCLFDDPSTPLTKSCTGEYVLMEIPKDNKCKDQIGKFKCVKRVYSSATECAKFCPKSCKKNRCA